MVFPLKAPKAVGRGHQTTRRVRARVCAKFERPRQERVRVSILQENPRQERVRDPVLRASPSPRTSTLSLVAGSLEGGGGGWGGKEEQFKWVHWDEGWPLTVCRIQDVYPRSRIWIFTHPGSRISDPGSKNSKKRERWKKIYCNNFLCSHKFHKNANYFSFEVLKKKIWANFQGFIELLTQKIVNKLSKIWVWDPGSEIQDPEKTYSGSRIQGSKRHRIPDPDPQHWPLICTICFKINIIKRLFTLTHNYIEYTVQ